MAKFEVLYVVTTVRKYRMEMSGTEDTIDDKAQARLDKILTGGKVKFPGDIEDEDICVEVESCEEQ